MKMWTWSLSRKWKSIQKLDPVLKQAGISSPPISVQFSVKLFQKDNTVPYSLVPKILKRTLRERRKEKEENTYFMKMWTW